MISWIYLKKWLRDLASVPVPGNLKKSIKLNDLALTTKTCFLAIIKKVITYCTYQFRQAVETFYDFFCWKIYLSVNILPEEKVNIDNFKEHDCVLYEWLESHESFFNPWNVDSSTVASR